MSHYDPSVPHSQFRQGEVLRGLLELRFDSAQLSEASFASPTPPAERQAHPWTIILSPDCDLEWDFNARQGEANVGTKQLSHVLLCDLEDLGALQADGRVPKSQRLTQLVTQNRDERYHHLPSAVTQDGQLITYFFVDFKRVFSLHVDYLYAVTDKGFVERCGFLKAPWLQHLAHRFTYFLGRVGLPDAE